MNTLTDKLLNRESGITLYSLTPPEKYIAPEKLQSLNKRRAARIQTLDCDGLSIYDVQEEKGRDSGNRTFQYREAMNPLKYSRTIQELKHPRIIYLVAGKYSKKELQRIFSENSDKSFVLVGPSDKLSSVKMTLKESMTLAASCHRTFGAIFIGEREGKHYSETNRLISKIQSGADFFISQCIYDISYYENLIRSYSKETQRLFINPKPLIFTLSPVGTTKALKFMEWLGVGIDKEFHRSILFKEDFLKDSIDHLEGIACQLIELCREWNVPYGFNFESVISRRLEVLASLELADRVKSILDVSQNNTGSEKLNLLSY